MFIFVGSLKNKKFRNRNASFLELYFLRVVISIVGVQPKKAQEGGDEDGEVV
jgi:hypothetical protein